MILQLKINGVDRTDKITWNSLKKTDVLNDKVDTLSFSINKYGTQTYYPEAGQSVELIVDSVTTYKGIILTVNKSSEGHSIVRYDVSCVDNSYYLGRVLVAETYTDTTIEAVINTLIADYAPSFTTVNVDAAIAVETVTFNYITVKDAISKIAKMSNHSWYVDYNNDLHFFAKNTELSPFNISDTSNNYIYDSLEISDDISQLRNRVFVRGGEAEGDPRTETFNGDGTKKFFKLSNKFSKLPTVTVGGVPQTVGVDFLDNETDFNILWSYQESYLKFTNAPASGTNNISVNGIPLYQIRVLVENTPSIAANGLAEIYKEDVSVKSSQEAIDLANAELNAYAAKISEGSFSTYTPGLRSGQTITVNSPARMVNEAFLIQRVSFQMISQDMGFYSVELATLKTITLIDYLLSQLSRNATILKDSDTVLIEKVLTFTEAVGVGETFTAQALNYAVTFHLTPQAVTGTSRPFIIEGSLLS
jgi:hypothetical protein